MYEKMFQKIFNGPSLVSFFLPSFSKTRLTKYLFGRNGYVATRPHKDSTPHKLLTVLVKNLIEHH